MQLTHLDCSELSEHEFGFYSNNDKDPFYFKKFVKEFELNNVKSDGFCRI